MNLDAMNVTPAQRASITRVEGPLLICAGAGSGKTFTLQQRIAYGLSAQSGPAVEGIDRLLAITFTTKAADEIKSRVRAALREQGMSDQALKVDDAWISTIHSMALRILDEYALELGFVPGCASLSSAEAAAIRDEAYRVVIEQPGCWDELVAMYGPSQAKSLVYDVLDRAASLTDGLEAFDFGWTSKETPASLLRSLCAAFEELLGADLTEAQQQGIQENVLALSSVLTCGLSDDIQGYEQAIEVFNSLSWPAMRGKAKELFESVCYEGDRCGLALNYGAGRLQARAVMTVARAVQDLSWAHKQDQGAMELNDILRKTYEGLAAHPELCAQLQERFQWIMVDEFQDTNQLQIDLISMICKPHLANLCTVGDSQQSIYRFQGADVGVYLQHKQEMANPQVGAQCTQLDLNFRSHGDILAFVRAVCGQPGFFAEEFLDLQPGRDEERVQASGRGYKGSEPRVSLSLVSYDGKALDDGTKISVDVARAAAAQSIAEWFAELRAAGHDSSEMVLLLGATTYADIYIDALRAHGFSPVMAAGSGFFQTPEADLVAALLAVLANPLDEEPLLKVLTSPLFRLNAEELLELGTKQVEEAEDKDRSAPAQRRQSVGRAMFMDQADSSPQMQWALGLLRQAWQARGVQKSSSILEEILINSGYLEHLQQGDVTDLAKAANVFKALNLVAELEEGAVLDASSLSLAFQARFYEKEKLGTLSGEGRGSLRIMTVHGSKGLEFPFVAVAECFDVNEKAQTLDLLVSQGQVYGALQLPTDERAKIPQKKGCSFREAMMEQFAEYPPTANQLDHLAATDTAAYAMALLALRKNEALAEKRRLFYVAATRASEAMFISCLQKEGASTATSSSVRDDIAQGLFDGEFPQRSMMVDYGGTEPLAYQWISARRWLQDQSEKNPDLPSRENGEAPLVSTAEIRELTVPQGTTTRSRFRQLHWSPAVLDPLYSYSSLADSVHDSCDQGGWAQDFYETLTDFVSGCSLGNAEVDIDSIEDHGPALRFAIPLDQEEPALQVALCSDADKATQFGSALHRVAQIDALQGSDNAWESLEPLVQTYEIKDAARLKQATRHWLQSDLRQQVYSHAYTFAEWPFVIEVKGETLHGEIDLLAADELGSGHATIVDYKTGGQRRDTEETLCLRHGLQACCYSYALLLAGYAEVEVIFVRVERLDKQGDPESIRFTFTQDALPWLRESLEQAIAGQRES